MAPTARGVTNEGDQRTTKAIAEGADIDDKVRSLLDFVMPGAALPSGLKLLNGAHTVMMITPFARLSLNQRKVDALLKVKTEPSDFTKAADAIQKFAPDIHKSTELVASLPAGPSAIVIKMELSELANDGKTMCHNLMQSVAAAVREQLKDLQEASITPMKAIRDIPDSDKIDTDLLLAATNTTRSRALRAAWARYASWRELPSDIAEALTQALPQWAPAPSELMNDDDMTLFSGAHSSCASMAIIQSMHRSLKQTETRPSLLAANHDMWLAGDGAATLPTKLGMLFDLAYQKAEASA